MCWSSVPHWARSIHPDSPHWSTRRGNKKWKGGPGGRTRTQTPASSYLHTRITRSARRKTECVCAGTGEGEGIHQRRRAPGGRCRCRLAVAALPVPSLESYVVDDDGRLPAPTVQQQGICTEEVAKHFHVDGGRSSSATSAALPSFTGGDRAQGERGGTYCLTKRPPSVSLSCSDEVGRWRMGVGRRIATCRLGAIALEYHEGQNKGSAPRPCRKLALPPPADHNPG